MNRPSRDETFMRLAEEFARRSTCRRGQTGVVIVQENRVIASGYNGAPPSLPHCTEVGCDELTLYRERKTVPDNYELVEMGCQRAVHAELNAISFAARWGARCEGATMYCVSAPCLRCAQAILGAGIVEVIYKDEYRAQRLDLLEEAGVKVMRLVGR